ncbi:MAG: Chaperone for flagella basal body P-ring formation, partial [Pseudomonadota bacterium]
LADGARVRVACPAAGWGFALALRRDAGPTAAAADCRMIRRGDRIAVTVRGAGFAVQGEAVAEGDACDGAALLVRYDRRGPPVRVTATGPGRAEMTAP